MTWLGRSLRDLSVQTKILGLGFAMVALLLAGAGLSMASFSSMTSSMHAATAAHQLAMAAAQANEQWTLDDDQSNMYAAVVALRDPTQRQLAETTYQQAIRARAAVGPALASVQALATSAQELALLHRIEASLSSYDSFTRLMRQQALAGHIQRAVHVVTVENLVPSNDLPIAFAALEAQANASVAQANAAANASAAAGTRLLLILCLFGLLAALPGWLLARAIVRPLRDVQRTVESLSRVCIAHLAAGIGALARGDLTVRAEIRHHAPFLPEPRRNRAHRAGHAGDRNPSAGDGGRL